MVLDKRQAQYKYSVSGELKKQENGLYTKNLSKKRDASFFFKALGICCVVALIGFFVITYIHQYVKISNANYKINQLRTEYGQVKAENDKIRLQIAQNKSLRRIEEEARTQLKMVDPSQKEIYYLSMQKTTQNPKDEQTMPQNSNATHFIHDMLAWLKNLTSVEAGTLDD